MRFHFTVRIIQDALSWPAAIRTVRPDDVGRERVFGEMPDRVCKAYLRRGTGPAEGAVVRLGRDAYRVSARLEYPGHTELTLERCVQ